MYDRKVTQVHTLDGAVEDMAWMYYGNPEYWQEGLGDEFRETMYGYLAWGRHY